MKKNNPLYLVLFAIMLALANCSKVENKTNLSSVITIPIGTSSNTAIPYYTLDNTGSYLFIFIRDFNFASSIMLKVNMSSYKIEKQLTFDGVVNSSVPIMSENIVVTDNNELICGFHNFTYAKQLLIKFDKDLNVLKVDTIADSYGGNYGRTRLLKDGPGKITGMYSHQDTGTGKWFLRYQRIDENMNILSSVTDTSSFYGNGPIGSQSFIKTLDGGYLYAGADFANGDALIEKRDANFKLIWRTRYSGGGDPRSLNEMNSKYYAYCMTDSAFTLIYDLNGNLLNKVIYSIPGATVTKNNEPMRKTDNGEFLIAANIVYSNNPLIQTGILFRADANANIISYQNYGSRVLGSSLIKINSNKYLLFYADYNFKPDGASQPRLVFQYVDAKGNFIN